MSNTTSRLNRMFAPDGKCFDVAIDHGFFNEAGIVYGRNVILRVKAKHWLETVVAKRPD